MMPVPCILILLIWLQPPLRAYLDLAGYLK